MPVQYAGMQIPDQRVKPPCTKSAPLPTSRKSLQGALQLVLRGVGRAGIKFAPPFASAASGSMLKARGNEASKQL